MIPARLAARRGIHGEHQASAAAGRAVGRQPFDLAHEGVDVVRTRGRRQLAIFGHYFDPFRAVEYGARAPSANASMTGNAPTFVTLLLRVFLPFAFAYFLSYIF